MDYPVEQHQYMPEKAVLLSTKIGNYTVSTVFLGDGVYPYQTVITGEPGLSLNYETWYYVTKEDAQRGHPSIVEWVKQHG